MKVSIISRPFLPILLDLVSSPPTWQTSLLRREGRGMFYLSHPIRLDGRVTISWALFPSLPLRLRSVERPRPKEY